jgi:hypothetical protein
MSQPPIPIIINSEGPDADGHYWVTTTRASDGQRFKAWGPTRYPDEARFMRRNMAERLAEDKPKAIIIQNELIETPSDYARPSFVLILLGAAALIVAVIVAAQQAAA